MKEQFLNLSGLTELVTYIKLCIAQHKMIIPRASFSLFPKTGDENNIYIDTSTNSIYRWNDSDKSFVLLAKPPRNISISEGKNNGQITLKVDEIESNATVHGLKSAAFSNASSFATSAQGAKADSAIQSITIAPGTNNGTVKITVNGVTTDNIKVAGLGSAAFSDIAVFAPAKHTHSKSDVGLGNVDNTADIDKSVKYAGSSGSSNTVVYTALTNTDLNTLQTEGKWYYAGGDNTCTNVPVESAAFELYVGRNASGWRYQQFTVTSGEIYIRVFDSSNWGNWRKLAFTSDTVTAASSVPWNGITGKPSTFAPSSHNHTIANITDIGKASVNFANSAGCPQGFSSRTTTATWGNQTGTVVTDWHTSNGGDIAFRDNSGQLNVVIDGFFYQNEGKNLVLDSGNYSNYAATKIHTHTISNITNLQTTLDGKSNTNHTHDLNQMINTLTNGTSDPADTDYYIAQYAGGGSTTTTYHRRPHSALWNYIKSKANSVYQPKGSYAASSHTHDDRYYTESEINTKLASKSDTSHTHNYVVGSYTGNGGQQKPNYFGTNKVGFLMMNTTVNGDSNYKDWIIMDCYGGNDVGGSVALGVNRQKLAAYIMRSAAERSSWAESAELLHTLNYTSYTVTKTGSGASGTWGINITGASGSCTGNAATASNASKVNGHTVNSDVPSGAKFTDTNTWRPLGTTADTACAGNDNRLSNARPASDVYSWAKASSKPSYSWSEITSKPSTFTPASHTHAYIPLSGGTITGSIIRSSGGSWISARNNVVVRGTATTKDSWNPVVGQATPNGYWTIGNLASNDNLAFSYTSNTNYNAGNNSATTVYLPVQEGTIITSATIGSQSVKYATSAGSAGSVAWGNVSGKPSSYTPSSHTHDDRYYTETEINTKLGAKLGAVSANGYYGMARPDGNTSDWIRTTTTGIIPYQSGGAGGGHCGLGTSSWYFSNAYIDTVNCVNASVSGHIDVGEYIQSSNLINTYFEYQSNRGTIDWRFGSATATGDENFFGFYDAKTGKIPLALDGNFGNIYVGFNVGSYESPTAVGVYLGGQVAGNRAFIYNGDSYQGSIWIQTRLDGSWKWFSLGRVCSTALSDIRLKGNIRDTEVEDATKVIESMKIRSFERKDSHKKYKIGFIADELEQLDPNLIDGGGEVDGHPDYKSVNNLQMLAYVVKGMQELNSKVTILEQENKRLKQKLNMCN
ncbi:tail fiber domain-containing protein [Blautia faecis]|uniref:tail fiber domain-containing protein n=1 Tax=Blautia faecis TaxID=871665 RepID=UPI0028A5656D|nr:tail fiber domain-containing protein [Blautia faecis]MDT4368383.1 tail fiber domain-containing protein [Blautia faecis]